MAKDRRKLQHIHSSIPDRQPTPATLEVGEIAVNNAANQEFLSVKNSNDRVVRFSSDEQIMTWTEKKEVMPYKGYVRGEIGPSSTSGETPTSDIYGSYGITDNDLLTNKSNIIIKLNQVAADNTIKHNRVNGAKDAYDKYVNPTEDGGITDGAGFYIDMSRYAMQGANPTFSGITNTCYTELNGRTEILGGDGTEGDCRSLLNVDVLSATTNISSAWTAIGTDNIHVSGTTTEVHDGDVVINNNSDKAENTTGDVLVNTTGATAINNSSKRTINVTGGTELNSCDSVLINTNDYKVQQCDGEQGSAEFNFCDSFKVNSDDVEIKQCSSGKITIVEKEANYSGETLYTYTSGNTVVNADGNVGITAKGDIMAISTEKDIYITANDNICETAGINATFYGLAKTNIGLNCEENGESTITNIYGETINVVSSIEDHETTSFTVDSVTACINSTDTASIGGANKTNIGYDCEGNEISEDTNIYGDSVNISGDNVNMSAVTVNITAETTNITGDTNIDGVLCVTSGLCKTLTWEYGNVQTENGNSTNFKDNASFIIPKCASDINRATLSYSYGDVRTLDGNSGGTYDPGENCSGVSVSDTITIPTSLDHLIEFNGSCYVFNHDICMEDSTIVANGFYSKSDMRLKENISTLSNEELEKVDKIKFKSFNFKGDESKRKTYGVIAQEVQDAGFENIVHTNEDGMLNVDYTSLLLLKIASMEKTITELKNQISNLSDRLNFGNN